MDIWLRLLSLEARVWLQKEQSGTHHWVQTAFLAWRCTLSRRQEQGDNIYLYWTQQTCVQSTDKCEIIIKKNEKYCFFVLFCFLFSFLFIVVSFCVSLLSTAWKSSHTGGGSGSRCTFILLRNKDNNNSSNDGVMWTFALKKWDEIVSNILVCLHIEAELGRVGETVIYCKLLSLFM